MRFLCIAKNRGFGTTALSQPGLQKRRGEAPGASAFFDHWQVHFSALHSVWAFFLLRRNRH